MGKLKMKSILILVLFSVSLLFSSSGNDNEIICGVTDTTSSINFDQRGGLL